MSSNENDVTTKKNWPEVPAFERKTMKFRNNKWSTRENTMCVWYYDETLLDNAQREVKRELGSLFDYIRIFTDPDSFTAYLGGDFIVDNIIFIICGRSIRPLCHLAQHHHKCYHLYELNLDDNSKTQSRLESWTMIHNISSLFENIDWTFMETSYLLEPFRMAQLYGQTFATPVSSFSIFDSDLKETDLSSMNKEALEFLLFQSLTKVLLDAKHDSYAFEEMFLRCRQHFKDKKAVFQKIDDLQKNYRSDQAISYYAQNTPLNQLVQTAFYMKDIELIFALRFYISDLHKQVIQAANKQHRDSSTDTIILYRPLQLLKTDLQKLNDHIDCLISINEFFSSTEKDTDDNATSEICEDQDNCNILLKLYIDSTMTNKSPCVYLAEYGAISQNEVLFSTCSVWRLQSINETNNKNWVVTLTLSNDFESYLSNFHDKLLATRGLLTLADLCCKLKQYSAARVFYHRMLKDEIPGEICDYKYLESLEMVEAEIAPQDFIKLRPNELTIKSRSQTWVESLEDSQDIIILCLNVDMSETNQLSLYNIESFQDEFQFIARALSIKDKIIYVIISLTMADYVIPLIHRHYCIETIYLYGSTNSETSFNWSSISEKISGPVEHLEDLCDQITGNIKTKVARHLHWNQNSDVFLRVYTQQREADQCYDIKPSNLESQNERIVIFHCDEQMLFQAERGYRSSSQLDQFTDLKECLDFINARSELQIFLVISGNTVPLEIQSTLDYPQIHGIYFFCITPFKSPFNKRKVKGLFHKLIDLSEKLHNDIQYFQEQHFHTIRIDMCPKLNHDKTLIGQLNNKQIDFLTLQLFIDILLQIPVLEFETWNLLNIGRRLAYQIKSENIEFYVEELYKNYKETDHFEQNIKFLLTMIRFKQDNRNDLMALQRPLRNIQNRVFESLKILTSINVYLAKIISNDTLETIQSSIGEYINIGTFVLATKSLQTARTIARQTVNNGIISVLFEIEVIRGTHLLNVDNDRVIFSLGAVFELESINLGPDNVWYVKIKCADAKFQLLKEQLQIETGVHLSWLTYGNYLSFLNRVEHGSAYYEYILKKCCARDVHWSPLQNNYGLMYTSNETEEIAQRHFDAAFVGNKWYSPESSGVTSQDQLNVVPSIENMVFSITEIDLSVVFGRMGMIYYKMNNPTKALEFYRKAFESATNQLSRHYYHQRILLLSKRIPGDPIDISVELKASDTYVSTVEATDKQTFIGVWFHDNHLSTDQYDKMRLYFNQIFYYYRIFDDMMEFSRYIGRRQLLSKVFLIVSDITIYSTLAKLGQKSKEIFQKVYVFLPTEGHIMDAIDCFNTSCVETLFEELSKDISQYIIEENSLNIVRNTTSVDLDIISRSRLKRTPSFVVLPDLSCRPITSIQHSTKESLKFLSFQVIIDIILGTSYNSTDLSDMWKTCHYLCMEDEVQLSLIEKLKISYQGNEVINYYTEHSYLSQILNQAFHTGNMKQIFEFRVYISDLYKKLKEIDRQQEIDGTKSSINRIYFGTTLSENVLQQLMDNEGGLISFSGFLSIVVDPALAFMSDGAKQVSTKTRSVLFQLQIDKKMKQPYAVISQYGTKSDELEILFSCGTIWRINSVNLDKKLCTINLASCGELGSQLVELREKYIQGNCTLMSLGDILHELGEDDEAEWFYRRVLEQKSLADKIHGHIYYKIGMIRYEKEIYLSALENLEKSAHLLELSYHKVNETMLPHPLYMYNNESVLLTVYNNMGIMFQKNGKYNEAVEQYQKALKEKGTDFELATVHNNLGLLYFEHGDYTAAREHHLKAIELIDEHEFYWAEFKKNFDHVNQCFQYRANKPIDDNQVTTVGKLYKAFDCDEDHYGKREDVVQFRLSEDDLTTDNIQLSTNLTSRTWFQNSDENQNVIILCFGVELPNKNVFSDYNVQSYDNPFKFIASVLSIKDKTIYLIISTTKSYSTIPIINKHYCIEKIYLYGSVDTESSSTWSLMSEKISGSYSDIDNLCEQIVNDITITTERPLRWNRSLDLFTMLHTQRSENQYSVIEVSVGIPGDEYLVILHCNNRKLFHINQTSIPTSEFLDAQEYAQFINEQTQSQIFLIVAGSMIPSEIQLTFDFRQIYAVYFFRNNEYKYSTDKRKVSGLFNKLEDLSEQLHKDILFYREQHVHTSRIDMCPRFDRKNIHIKELNDQQIFFLKSQLFMDILPQTSLLEFKQEDLFKICHHLFPGQGEETAYYVSQLREEKDQVKNLDQNLRFLQIMMRLHQLQQLNDLFILQQPLIEIQTFVLKSDKISTTITVYVTRIVLNDILESMPSNIGGYISIGILVLATKSLTTARTIARQAANNNLTSVLFEIEVMQGTHLLNVDNDRVICRLGAVFCIKAIDRAPDGVWYARIKCVDKEFHLIKEQLEFETNVKLSWLTYGNYLYFLNRFEEGEAYFTYLLDKLSSEHIYQSAIYNNMGLLYTKKYEIEGHKERDKEQYLNKAKAAYGKSLGSVELIESNSTVRRKEDQPCKEILTSDVIPTNTYVDYSTVVGNIADLYYKTNNYDEAMKSYMDALKLSPDQQSCRYYQKMILATEEQLKKEKTNSS